MKNFASCALALILMMISLAAGAGIPASAAEVYTDGEVLSAGNESTDLAETFAGRRIGIPTGSVFDQMALKQIPDCVITYINGYADLALALESGKIDAYTADEPVARLMTDIYPGQYVAALLEAADYGYIFRKESERSERIRTELSEYICLLRENGTLEELDSIWFGDDEALKTVVYPEYEEGRETIRMAASSEVGEPFAYMKDGEMVGYDIDIIARFCTACGYNLEVTDYTISGLMAAVSSGKSDLAGSSIALTEERSESFDFSEPDYIGGIVLVTKSTDLSVIGDVSDDAIFEKLRGNTIGVLSGSISGEEASKKVPECTILSFNSAADLAVALDTGKIDAYCADHPVARALAADYPDQTIYAVVSLSDNAFIFPKDSLGSSLLCAQMNGYLKKLRSDGTLKAIASLWIDETDESLKVVDMSGLTGESGTLTFALSTTTGAPSCYLKDGVYVGYDVDIAVRFCREYGYNIEFADYSFSGLLDAVSSGKADFGGSCISVTEERKESLLFSDANYNGGSVIVIKGSTPVQKTETGIGLKFRRFLESVSTGFEKTLLREDRWKMFLSGIGVTLLITLLSALFGSALGFLLYLLYRKKNPYANAVIRVFSDILGKTPVVVILMVLYYVIFVNTSLSGAAVSVIGFTLLFCFSVLGLLENAESALPKIQREAALALGYTEMRAYIQVLLPQTWQFFLPGFQTELVNLIKATAIVGYIAVQDLTKVSDIIRSRTYEAFFPLITSAVIYFAIAWLLTFAVRGIARRLEKVRRNHSAVLRGVKR